MKGRCLLEREGDEDPALGPLASVLEVLKEVHREYFATENPQEHDVREILKRRKAAVLSGCKICFSRCFPKGTEPGDHPLWKLAEELGAVCSVDLDGTVTHVVTTSEGTEKALKAAEMGIHVVKPGWIHASLYHFKKAPTVD
mmetsp:Transcript_5451/g.11610  ORF Transcript_5451/g.11610 Transcript_5451/m.11610 type:complete len:142 (-) Transcript_5451:82-507(-)